MWEVLLQEVDTHETPGNSHKRDALRCSKCGKPSCMKLSFINTKRPHGRNLGTVMMWRPPLVKIQSLIGIRRHTSGGGWWARSGMDIGKVSVSYLMKYQRTHMERALRTSCMLVSTYESNRRLRGINHRVQITKNATEE